MPRTTKAATSSLLAELGQTRPFSSVAQGATIALLRTASVVNRAISRTLEEAGAGISLAQYNALRIVKGAGAAGIPTLDIGDRMIEQGSTITRLLDKLEEAGYLRRERSTTDRRQVLCVVTEQGRRLLQRLDPLINAADERVMDALSADDIGRLVRLLDQVRHGSAERGAARRGPTRSSAR
jgi:DNA-binding MarR family transcriptional regulator